VGKIHKDQKGFSAVEAVLLLVVVGLIGFVGWYVWHSKNQTDKVLTTSQNSQIDSAKSNVDKNKLDKTYTDAKDKLSFNYPSDWKLDIQKQDDIRQGFASGSLTSPDGKLVLNYSNSVTGGGGGSCPDAFPCPTVQIVSIADVAKAKDHQVVEKITNWAGHSDSFTVSIGLVSKDLLREWPVGSKQHNDFYLYDNFSNDGGLFALHYSPNARPEDGFKTQEEAKAFLASENAKTAKQILQSVSVQ